MLLLCNSCVAVMLFSFYLYAHKHIHSVDVVERVSELLKSDVSSFVN